MKVFERFFKKLGRLFFRCLDCVEVVGNALPHPATIFALLAVFVVFLSWLGHYTNFTAIHPNDGSTIVIKNLLSPDGLRWMYISLIDNFAAFPPLGVVLAVIVGTGIAEGSGLLAALIRALVIWAPKQLITSALILAGILSHLASDAGYVILIPLGAMTFYALGRHPMAGLAATFAGVSGGFAANFMVGPVDPLLAGLTTTGARILVPDMTVNPAVNLYFMIASSILVIVVGTWVTEKIVEPRLGKYEGNAEKVEIADLTKQEKKGLIYAGLSLIAVLIAVGFLVVPEGAVLRDPVTDSVLHSPFLRGIIVPILVMFFVPGLVYGIVVGTVKSDKDVMKKLTNCMNTMGSYIVLVFFAAQFVQYFGKSNLGIVLAIKGAELLSSINFTGPLLLVSFVVLSAIINLFMGSASAKWAIMAPVFVPMFMIMGYHPALTQMAYRIGDSVTNVITPMMTYFALIVTFAHKYSDKYGIGTIISTMVPYTIIFSIAWTILLVIWMQLGIPLGPDGLLYYVSDVVIGK